MFLGEKKAMKNLNSIIKSRAITLLKKIHIVKAIYFFSFSHVQMWELDHKKGWVLKNWFLRTVVLEKALESPLGSKEVNPVNPKGNQSCIFIGRTDAKAEAEAALLWPSDVKRQCIGNDHNLAIAKNCSFTAWLKNKQFYCQWVQIQHSMRVEHRYPMLCQLRVAKLIGNCQEKLITLHFQSCDLDWGK